MMSYATKAHSDPQYEEHTIREVSDSDGYWSFAFTDHVGIGCEKVEGIDPQPGDTVKLYGRGFGFPVRGISVNDEIVYYRTEQEQRDHQRQQAEAADRERRERFEANRAKMDAEYDALPPIFQARIDKFRRNNPDFRWKYESYELFVCTQAVLLANTLRTVEAIKGWDKINSAEHDPPYDYRTQIAAVPGWSDGHSGNTHGAAVALACWYLEQPEAVEQLHGALAPLVGSEEYGCTPAT